MKTTILVLLALLITTNPVFAADGEGYPFLNTTLDCVGTQADEKQIDFTIKSSFITEEKYESIITIDGRTLKSVFPMRAKGYKPESITFKSPKLSADLSMKRTKLGYETLEEDENSITVKWHYSTDGSGNLYGHVFVDIDCTDEEIREYHSLVGDY